MILNRECMFMYIMYGIPKDKRESAMIIYKAKEEVLT